MWLVGRICLIAYSHYKITNMPNAKKTLSLVNYCIVFLVCYFCNNSKLEGTIRVSTLYNDAAFNDNFMLSPVPPFWRYSKGERISFSLFYLKDTIAGCKFWNAEIMRLLVFVMSQLWTAYLWFPGQFMKRIIDYV